MNTPSLPNRLRTGLPVLAAYATGLAVLMPVLLLAYAMDSRTTLDSNVWLKPIKFDIAIAVYILTLSFFAHLLPDSWRRSAWFNAYVSVVGLTIVLEMGWLIFAAAIGEPSHFNQSHSILRRVYPIMGILAIMLISVSAVIGVGLLRHKASTLHPALRHAIGFSLIATFVLTTVTASYMSSAPAQTHAVLPDHMTTLAARDGIAIMGWLRGVGDLRVAHFFSTHALHFVPLLAYLLYHLAPERLPLSQAGARNFGLGLSVAYGVFVLAVFAQAIAGRPFMS